MINIDIYIYIYQRSGKIYSKNGCFTSFISNSIEVRVLNLQMDIRNIEKYNSNTQKIRVITETWVEKNMFCPYCGSDSISGFENNRPVADFFCPFCKEEYELKSKSTSIRGKVNDGAYATMIDRINSTNNPNFFFMHYRKNGFQVENFIMVPKYFFTPDIIEKRKPLADTARRAGWVGCNILLDGIPDEGKIYIVQNEKVISAEKVIDKVHKTEFLRESKLNARGWTLDVLNCVNKIGTEIFTLDEMYKFENILSVKHPENHHIKDKIRQQLQLLRDRGIIEFVARGQYRRIQ